jgi:hypothetical protein
MRCSTIRDLVDNDLDTAGDVGEIERGNRL